MWRRKQRKWDGTDDDPTSGLINLVDIWMVFAVTLLLALIAAGVIHEGDATNNRQVTVHTDAAGKLEIVKRDSIKIKKMRVTNDQLTGQGERLGTAYRLKSGELVYVPEPAKP